MKERTSRTRRLGDSEAARLHRSLPTYTHALGKGRNAVVAKAKGLTVYVLWRSCVMREVRGRVGLPCGSF